MSEITLTPFYQIILPVESLTGTFISLLAYKSGRQADFIYPHCQSRKALRAEKRCISKTELHSKQAQVMKSP